MNLQNEQINNKINKKYLFIGILYISMFQMRIVNGTNVFLHYI